MEYLDITENASVDILFLVVKSVMLIYMRMGPRLNFVLTILSHHIDRGNRTVVKLFSLL